MNSNIEKLFKVIEKDIGYKEYPIGSNKTKFGESVGMNYQPWCVSAQYYWFKEAGLSSVFYGGGKVASCTILYNWAKKNGLLVEVPTRGDLVIFDWGHDGKPDHIGIIEKTNGDTLYTIEGNTSAGNDSNGGEVMRRTRSATFKYAYIRPKYPKDVANVTVTIPALERGQNNTHVKSLQILLNGNGFDCGKCDGIFGNKTELAVIEFQKKNALTVDGIVGKNTWGKII